MRKECVGARGKSQSGVTIGSSSEVGKKTGNEDEDDDEEEAIPAE
jgi:hypothetical protein